MNTVSDKKNINYDLHKDLNTFINALQPKYLVLVFNEVVRHRGLLGEMLSVKKTSNKL